MNTPSTFIPSQSVVMTVVLLFLPLLPLVKMLTHQVKEAKAKSWCVSKGNTPYMETSAKEDYNVEAAFEMVAKLALKNEPEEEIYIPDTIPVSSAPTEKKSSGCC